MLRLSSIQTPSVAVGVFLALVHIVRYDWVYEIFISPFYSPVPLSLDSVKRALLGHVYYPGNDILILAIILYT